MSNGEVSEGKVAATNPKSAWDIIFGFSGLLAVCVTMIVAFITYKQNIQIQALQTASSRDVERTKSQTALAVQKSAGDSSVTVAELNNALNRQLGELSDDRERSLTARDLEMKKYINDENIRLGRYSKQSDVDLKLVDIATELLRSESTQSNQELRHWAVDIVNSHSNVQMSKAATAEAIAGPITGEPVAVFVMTRYATGVPTTGCEVFYQRPGSTALLRFPELTNEGKTNTRLSKGPYEFWVACEDDGLKSDKRQFYAQESPLAIELKLPYPKR